MNSAILTLISALAGTLIGGMISWLLQKQRFEQELQISQEMDKTDFMAETTARYFLSHKGYTDRSFDLLQKRLGGFEDNELRKILVRAGAIRFIREDGSEWWRLLSRQGEFIERKLEEKEQQEPGQRGTS